MISSKDYKYSDAIEMQNYMLTSLGKHCKLTNKSHPFAPNISNPTEKDLVIETMEYELSALDFSTPGIYTLEESIFNTIYWSDPKSAYWSGWSSGISFTIHRTKIKQMEHLDIIAISKRMVDVGMRAVDMLIINHHNQTAHMFSRSTSAEAYIRIQNPIYTHHCSLALYQEIRLHTYFGLVKSPDELVLAIEGDPFVNQSQDLLWKRHVDILDDFKTWAKLDSERLAHYMSHYLNEDTVLLNSNIAVNQSADMRVQLFLKRKLRGDGNAILDVFDSLPISILWNTNDVKADIVLTAL